MKIKISVQCEEYKKEEVIVIKGVSLEKYNQELSRFIDRLKSKSNEDSILSNKVFDSFFK